MSGFGLQTKIANIPLRHYFVEYKFRLPETPETLTAPADDVEDVIQTTVLSLPVLRDVTLEQQWLMFLVQVFLSSDEAKQKGINQAFVFYYDPRREAVKDLILRMETAKFTDEESKYLELPEEDTYSKWRSQLNTKFQRLYGVTINQWFQHKK